MNWDAALTDTAKAFTDTFGESVRIVYRPRNGAPREITAVIFRDAPETDEGQRGTLVPSLLVAVENNVVTGISSAEVNTGGDRISLVERRGGEVRELPIMEMPSHDSGMLYLRLAVSR